MSIDVSDLRPTIVPKSDQLNAEQLLAGPMTITVTDVRIGSAEQPVIVHYEGENGRPFKPCKTMRKVLLFAWGPDGREWIGRSMTLYNDTQVKFGGDEVGGIRISHMSDIDKRVQVSLTATRGKKALHTVEKLTSVKRAPSVEDIRRSLTIEALKDNFGAAYKATTDAELRATLKKAYDKRTAELMRPAKTLPMFIEDIDNAADETESSLVLEEARKVLSDAELTQLEEAHQRAWT